MLRLGEREREREKERERETVGEMVQLLNSLDP
jgi:hypothetical protein